MFSLKQKTNTSSYQNQVLSVQKNSPYVLLGYKLH